MPEGVTGLFCSGKSRDGKTGKPKNIVAVGAGIGKGQNGDHRAKGGRDAEVGENVPNAEMVALSNRLETIFTAHGAQAKCPVGQCRGGKGAREGAAERKRADGEED